MLLISRKYCKAGHALCVRGAEDKPVVPGKEGESRARTLEGSRQGHVTLRSSCCGPGSAGLGPGPRFPGQKGRVPFPPSPLSLSDLPALRERRYLMICCSSTSFVDFSTVFHSISLSERTTRGSGQQDLH